MAAGYHRKSDRLPAIRVLDGSNVDTPASAALNAGRAARSRIAMAQDNESSSSSSAVHGRAPPPRVALPERGVVIGLRWSGVEGAGNQILAAKIQCDPERPKLTRVWRPFARGWIGRQARRQSCGTWGFSNSSSPTSALGRPGSTWPSSSSRSIRPGCRHPARMSASSAVRPERAG